MAKLELRLERDQIRRLQIATATHISACFEKLRASPKRDLHRHASQGSATQGHGHGHGHGQRRQEREETEELARAVYNWKEMVKLLRQRASDCYARTNMLCSELFLGMEVAFDSKGRMITVPFAERLR